MSQSLDIIRHILDENLIDAKKATEGYLNDILSGAIKEQYKEVAPSLVEDKGGKGGEMTSASVTGAPSAVPPSIEQQSQGESGFENQQAAGAWLRQFQDENGNLTGTPEEVFAAAFAEGYTDGQSIAYLVAMMPGSGPGGPTVISDPVTPGVANRDRRRPGGPGAQG